MCDANNERSIEGLTALAARFIAETNHFLNRFRAHPSVGWPLKSLIGTEIGLPHFSASAGPDRAATPTPLAHSEHASLPEFVLQRNRFRKPAGGNEAGLRAVADSRLTTLASRRRNVRARKGTHLLDPSLPS